MSSNGKDLERADGGDERPPVTYTASSNYLVTVGSIFASAALSVLIVTSSPGLLWTLFGIGLVAILAGLVWGRPR